MRHPWPIDHVIHENTPKKAIHKNPLKKAIHENPLKKVIHKKKKTRWYAKKKVTHKYQSFSSTLLSPATSSFSMSADSPKIWAPPKP